VVIFRAAVCPGAPLLIPGVAADLAAQVPELTDACDRAVGMLRAADRLLMLCSGPRARDARARSHHSVIHPAGTTVSSALITGTSWPASFTARLAGPPAADPPLGRPADNLPAGPPAGVGVIVGAALLERAGITAPLVAVDLADPTAEVDCLLDEAQASADRVGLLVVAEGSAGRGALPPGGGPADAELLDAALAAALAAGNPAALHAAADVDEVAAARLLFRAGPALRALADSTASHPPEQAELLLHQAPFGVGYLVAAWSWAG
jgi:hypothetical protein